MPEIPHDLMDQAKDVFENLPLGSERQSIENIALALQAERMRSSEPLVRLVDALLRKDTAQDGNWGWPSFHEELVAIRATLSTDDVS